MRKSLLFFLLVSNFVCFGQVDLNLGLRAYYPFSGNANDVSGNGNNPVFNNATLTADRVGNPNSAYHFNGTSSYMKILNSPSINMGNTMSLALWVKPMGYYTGSCYNNMMMMKADQDYVPGLYSLRFSDVYNGCTSPSTTVERFYDGLAVVATNPLVQLNQWYSVIVTYDGTTAKMYVNCTLQASAPYSGSFTNLYDLYLGHTNNVSFPYWLNGDLDEVRIYNRALTVDEVNVLGGCPAVDPCNTWLRTQAAGQKVTLGDLDVSGIQLSVEATINRSAAWSGNYLFAGDVVSKHDGPPDVNYLLRPNSAEITTSNGYFVTPPVCLINLNKTYHVAMTYDGTTLKFYRNGFLMSQVPATGTLIQNNHPATVGDRASGPPIGTNFQGYINEVRIWNVTRTQAQIQANMNSSLPNPTTQTGLRGYYIFDDLVNKQGNAAYNGTLNGGATINNTNPNCSFVADSCTVVDPCNTWLRTQAAGQKVTVGDLDVTGNQLTIEANFNRTAPPSAPGSYGFLISKHTDALDNNYALWPNGCALTTTTNAQAFAVANCYIELNKTYHVAMVYDGTTLKFYRNGFLHSQTPMSGNLITNNLLTTIAENPPGGGPIYSFLGDMNEVRIWNVARTQAQLQTYMNTPLPNPTTQAGLQGYYTFDNLLNKQGNAAYNGTLTGGATINNTNPNCSFTTDSCAIANPCATWLRTQAVGQKVTVGDLDITGNQMTIEANFNCTSFPFAGVNKWEDIVSKHANTTDANYVLRMDLAAITTTTGHYLLSPPCDNLVLNKTYHVAMVYNGSTLKFYRNGILLAQMPITGNLALNNWQTTIGDYAVNNPVGTNFFGYINEVRMWNVARTQAEIQAYMNSSLPNPASQTGLLGYYTFNSLLNKQGNTTYNGTLLGGATINNTNPNCTLTPETFFVADAGNDTTICTNTIASLSLHASAGSSYAWTPAVYLNNPAIQNPTASITTTTRFYVTVTNAQGCTAMDSVLITVIPAPVGIRYPDVTGYIYQPIQLQARNLGGNSYSWLPPTGLNNSFIINPVFSGLQSQEFRIYLTNAIGCPVVDTQLVKVDGKKGLWVPRGFSPNADGVNDRLYPIMIGLKQLNFFKVYNRWGNLIFETNSADPAKGWDGKYKGQLQPMETYTWVAEAMDFDGTIIKKNGNTFLIR